MSALQDALDPFRRAVLARMRDLGWSYGRTSTEARIGAPELTNFLAGCEPQRRMVEALADAMEIDRPDISDEVWGWHAGVNRGR